MDIKITTTELDGSLAVNAYRLYKAGDYKTAIDPLLNILDLEPQNWQARLFLSVCYFKTQQLAAAMRAVRHVFEKCPDSELRGKACLALQAMNAEMERTTSKPAEFGRFCDPLMNQPAARLESVIG